ncbi:MAG TPA: adenylate/guanylate cyclase domain-containing protein [Nitrospirales bacterium]|nr:response regulator [Nitrospira sp.]MCB9710991.1 response regulator [Nitrospiraceae bacterium]HQU27670.1 adenylate/guanylate cyclase domain-containing protein [Nitrospirales bacterium]
MNNRILIAEDSPIQATLLKRTLTQQGFEIGLAKNGKDAVTLLNQQTYALVISDVEMPLMNGYELCRTMKQHASWVNIPIMLLTTLAEPEDLMTGLNAGADSFLTKPYDESVLLARVTFLLSHPILHDHEPLTDITFAGAHYRISATRQHIFNLLLSTYENARGQNRALVEAQMELKRLNTEIEKRRQESDRLLLNILPQAVANELKSTGSSTPVKFDDVSVLFTDFVGFTKVAEYFAPQALVEELEIFFNHFDGLMEQYGLEKLKTIGDSYMAAGGVPALNHTHPVDCVNAALAMQNFVQSRMKAHQEAGAPTWAMRVGIHTGPVIAGVIGQKKFAYDLWGDTVNMASRMESSGAPGTVNISRATYERVKDHFTCTFRGQLPAKNKGNVDMFEVNPSHR